ncbi:MAG: AraC family transcriptional regulator [Clostridia bacterium]|nr:AraC family transcriptional regulator [Clostridia bacterium]
MKKYEEELAPVKYGANAIRTASYKIGKGQNAIPMHWHDRMELIYLKSGKLKIGYEENIQALHSGEIYIIPPKTPHWAMCLSEKAHWDVLMFDIRYFYNTVPLSCDILPTIFDGRAKFKMTLKSDETAECYQRLIEAANKNTFESVALIYRLIDLLFKNALLEVQENVTKGKYVIEEALEFIKENLDKDLNTKFLAEKFNYSEEHFCRLFKESTKVTPTNYIKINRLNKAANLLKGCNHSISEVSALCGFNDHNYFTRCFKAHYGITPTEYIKREKL